MSSRKHLLREWARIIGPEAKIIVALDRTVHFYTQVMGAWLHFRDIISLSHITVRHFLKNSGMSLKRN